MTYFDVRHHRIRKPPFSSVQTWKKTRKAGVFKDLYSGERFWKDVFSVTVSNRNIGQICLNIYIFVLFFCLLLHHLAVSIRFPFYIFYRLLLYWSRSTTGWSGTTQRFVAVDLTIFNSIFWYVKPLSCRFNHLNLFISFSCILQDTADSYCFSPNIAK